MPTQKILYISGSVGLGHVTRDLEIARQLRLLIPDLELDWIATGPAALMLREAGENLVPEASQWIDYASAVADKYKALPPYSVNIVEYAIEIQKYKKHNVDIFRQFIGKHNFDLVIGDEAHEIVYALHTGRIRMKPPFVMMYDFVGMESVTKSLKEKLIVYLMNRQWAGDHKKISASDLVCLFIGELEDIPDKTFGFLLPNRRNHVRQWYQVLGYIVRFNPADYADRKKVRAKLGYGSERLIVCSIGGTVLGDVLLELCGQAYSLVKEQLPDLRMVLVCGPSLSPAALDVPADIDVRGHVPDLYEHFAASDLAIVMGGGTTTIELTALNTPFLYFPLEGHFEQADHIASRLDRHRAGVRMWFSQTTPGSLAEAIISNLGKEVRYEKIRIDGARRAAELIGQILQVGLPTQ